MLVHGICSRCGYLTFHEITVRGRVARRECTWCGRGYFMPWDAEQKAAVAEYEAHFEEMRERYPALHQLREPGDHVLPPPAERPARH